MTFVTDQHVDVFHHAAVDVHMRESVLPQCGTQIQVTGNSQSHISGGFHRLERALHGCLGNGRSDAGDMEPVPVSQHFPPFENLRLSQGDTGIGPIIDYLDGALVGTGLNKIQPESAFTKGYPGDINTVFAQLVANRVSQIVGRKRGDKGNVFTESAKAHCNIGFGSGHGHFK